MNLTFKGHLGIALVIMGAGSALTGISVGFYNSGSIAWAWGMLSVVVVLTGLWLLFYDLSILPIKRDNRRTRVAEVTQDVKRLNARLKTEEKINEDLKRTDDDA